MFKRVSVLWLGVSTAVVWLSCLELVEAAACEPIRIPMCRSMPWNMTKMPNHLHHSTQDNAVLAIEQYEGLVGINCSPALLFFLCAMYAPICTIDFQHEPIKPCKSVCQRARDGCEPIMRRYNHSWPENLACEEFPMYDRGVCISPEAIVTVDAPETSPDIAIHSNGNDCRSTGSDGCKCPTLKLTQKVYLRNNYNYVIRARVKEVRNKCHDVATTVQVKEVLKSSLVNIPKETVTLHTSSACLCPEIRTNEEYIIMGYEDEERARLLLVEGSIAVKWKDRLGKRVKNWDQKLRQDKRKGRSGYQNREKRIQPRDVTSRAKKSNKGNNAKPARQ
ncbi:secreted frizzled-related protein 3 [Callorhinchus milii]|uniref:Secreted frizzled-related protein 3 n=1 Tax=Callorhinchus milii TaxID=7868 RepID=V9KT41_CALMI|nr:secreted frizzled-related protein 3 [Callorhinchus milii]|eukprot:gi/632945922/ref/XP_007888301.1/ PREDICTED: secreted frizzled-related protein 3 [Callorhinchus milii]